MKILQIANNPVKDGLHTEAVFSLSIKEKISFGCVIVARLKQFGQWRQKLAYR